jgi:hypothetical protein
MPQGDTMYLAITLAKGHAEHGLQAGTQIPHFEKSGGLNGSTQHSPEVLSAGISMAIFVRER